MGTYINIADISLEGFKRYALIISRHFLRLSFFKLFLSYHWIHKIGSMLGSALTRSCSALANHIETLYAV